MASVLITGTSAGLGFATALTVARAGHTVYATMRNPARSPELAETAAKEGLPIHISTMDVDSDSSVKAGMEAIYREAKHLDVLVNNAGLGESGSVEELPLAMMRAVMETNYFGALRCIQAVVPDMRQRKSGCIINISSLAGRIANSPSGCYAASKFALEAISEALAQEMISFNVRVAIVEPGIIDTAMARRIKEPTGPEVYPQQRRFAHLFAASLKNPAEPSVVAKKVLEIIDSGTLQLRHPVGPDSEPLLAWRRSMTDEEWVALFGASDDVWYARLERDFGMEIRPRNEERLAGE
jgi:NAD(P)-dependent dehydrogenase (short-subunit alcohol dehydrogenase family)